MGVLGWFKELGEELVSADANDERDIYNAGGDWHNLRVDQKINLAKRMGYTLEFYEDGTCRITEDKSNSIVDGILGIFLGEGNDQ